MPRSRIRNTAQRRATGLLLAVGLLAGLAPATAAAAPEGTALTAPTVGPTRSDAAWTARTDRLVIVPAADTTLAKVRSRVAAAGRADAAIGRAIGHGARVLELGEDLPLAEVEAMAARLERDGLVASAAPDRRVTIAAAPNDPSYADQWHLHGDVRGDPAYGIDVQGAWSTTAGSSSVTVAVLDTGGLPHPDIEDRQVAGYDFVDGDDDATDPGDWCDGTPSSWHGLHVAGTIGASTGNGRDIAGVDQRARLQHVRVLGQCGGYLADVVDGIRWAAGLPVAGVPSNQTPADVINLSIAGAAPVPCNDGSDAAARLLQRAVHDARSAGSVVVAAAGNSDADLAHEPTWPATCDGVITVAATGPAGERGGYHSSGGRQPYSNVGGPVDLAAPGGDDHYPGGQVLSLSNRGSRSSDPEGWTLAFASGTSMAAPHVSGVVSLMLAANTGLTPDGVDIILRDTATPFPASPAGDRWTCSANPEATYHCGAGIVDAATATAAAVAADATPPPAPAKLTVRPGMQRVELSWAAVPDPTSPVTYQVYRSAGSACSVKSTTIYRGRARSFTDTGLRHGTTYRYCVTATDGAGNRSSLSATRTATTHGIKPTSVSGSAGKGCYAFAGDWEAAGREGIGWWCQGRTRLLTADGTLHEFNYGARGDVPVVADWNGDGRDTVSVIRDGTWHLNDELRGGAADRSFVYGRVSQGDVPVAGRWDREPRDLPGIVRDGTWHLRDRQEGGASTWAFVYGRLTEGDLPLVGDWNGDGRDTVGIVRQGQWHLRNVHAGGKADESFTYGRVLAGDVPIMGDWTGDGIATPAIVRDGQWHLKFRHAGGSADQSLSVRAP